MESVQTLVNQLSLKAEVTDKGLEHVLQRIVVKVPLAVLLEHVGEKVVEHSLQEDGSGLLLIV